MTLREPPALTEPPDDEFYAWHERCVQTGYTQQWAFDWVSDADADKHTDLVAKIVEQYVAASIDDVRETALDWFSTVNPDKFPELTTELVDTFVDEPDYGDRYEDRAA